MSKDTDRLARALARAVNIAVIASLALIALAVITMTTGSTKP